MASLSPSLRVCGLPREIFDALPNSVLPILLLNVAMGRIMHDRVAAAEVGILWKSLDPLGSVNGVGGGNWQEKRDEAWVTE